MGVPPEHQQDPHAQPPSVLQLVPYFILVIPILVTMFFMARRKGKNFLPYLALGLIPVVNFIVMIWLASQTDAVVKTRLEELEKKLNEKV